MQSPKFFALLLRIDHELAALTRANGCQSGGALHRADYPRKPRGCPEQVRPDFSSRLSYCCAVCRRRSTSMSVRFLGRRVYLAVAVVLVSARPGGPTPAANRLGHSLGVNRRTIARWQAWWRELFVLTPLWQTDCARFMPPVPCDQLPGQLIERFGGMGHETLMRLLIWLGPLTVRGVEPTLNKLHEAT